MKITKNQLKELILERLEGEVDKDLASKIATISLHDEHFLNLVRKGEINIETLIQNSSEEYIQVYAEELKKQLLNKAQVAYTKRLIGEKING
jgi:hypothetical protein